MATATTSKVEIQNLETASDYINNLLLSRGLLRNGEPISFAHPSQDEGGKQATIAKVINLVHDLILRRDRESDTLTKLSQDVASLRNNSALQAQAIQKLEARNVESERQLALKSASEKTALSSLKTAEARNKTLKEDMVRLKGTISQIRAQCANDVRKKELELKRLQKHLEPKRGREGSIQVGVTVITPGISLQSSMGNSGSRAREQKSLQDDAIEYFTRLAQELSTENEVLRSLAQSTTSTLRDLQGIPDEDAETSRNGDVTPMNITPHRTLEKNLTEALDQLRTLLTNPSFVPLEEVEIREEEIVRLREGWEKMETRWREALSLMNGWRKKMMETGDAINLDDLRKGLILGSTPITMPPPTSARKTRLSLNQLPSPDDSLVEDKSTSMSMDQQEESFRTALIQNARAVSPVRIESHNRLGMGLFPAPKVLRPTTGNTQRVPVVKRRSFEVVEASDDGFECRSETSPEKRRRISQENSEPQLDDLLAADLIEEAQVDDHTSEDEEPPMTLEEKLAEAKKQAREAAAALQRALARPAPQLSPKKSSNGPISTTLGQDLAAGRNAIADSDKPAKDLTDPPQEKPVKRTKVPIKVGLGGMKRSKRRSTLSPAELEGLLGA